MVELTKDTIVIKIKTPSPSEDLIDLQNVIIDLIRGFNFIASASETKYYDNEFFSIAKLLDFHKEISFNFEQNESLTNVVFNHLQDKFVRNSPKRILQIKLKNGEPHTHRNY